VTRWLKRLGTIISLLLLCFMLLFRIWSVVSTGLRMIGTTVRRLWEK